jgi:nicotinamidase-related amidase
MKDHNDTSSGNILLLVDFQEGFLGPNTEHLRDTVAKLVKDPFFSLVVATRFLNLKSGLWTKVLNWSGLQTTEEQRLAVALPKQSKIIDKTTYGIPAKELSFLLPFFKAGQVFLAGIETDVCVTIIAASLFDVGVAPIILSNYTGTDRGKEHQTHSLITLGRIVGESRVVPDVSVWIERSAILNTKGVPI